MASSTSSLISFPCDGEIFYPQEKKFEEMVIFTHHYGGHKKQMRRHIQFVNQLGFEALACNLFPQPFKGSFELLKNPRTFLSTLPSKWKKQILEITSLIHGKKIFFSFSFSCNVTSQLIHQVPGVTAAVFDGGPFAEFFQSSWKYLSYQERIENPILRSGALIPWNLLCGLFWLKFKIHKSLKKTPPHFPILSFQAEKDRLVPPFFTNNLLKPHSHLDITVSLIKDVTHLQGMKSRPEFYQDILKKFLIEKATAL